MTALPIDSDDPRDPQVILQSLPESARPVFLSQYHAAVSAAREPAGYKELQALLRTWAVRVKVYRTHPNYDEDAAARAREVAASPVEGPPIEDVIADVYGITAQEAATLWQEKIAAARAQRPTA